MNSSIPPANGSGGSPKMKGTPINTPAAPAGRSQFKYKLHWHVLLVHFPISFFVGSFGFMALHLITKDSCFQLAAYVALIAGAIVMIPTTLTGWTAWKNRYQGIKGKIFLRKIRISYAMLAVSIILVIYQTLFPIEFLDILYSVKHLFYFIGMTLLLLGAVAEGYYGVRLNHK